MGYDAFVVCNCYENNKLKKKIPFSEFVKNNQEGLWLDLSWEGNEDKHEQFDNWKFREACEHEDMLICCEHLSNIRGMGLFREAISKLGKDKYSTLLRHLPEVNGGFLESKDAAKFLQDLEQLESENPHQQMIVLTSINNEIIHKCYEDGPLVFAWSGEFKFSLDKNGFSIQKKSSKIFQSKKFEAYQKGQQVYYIDKLRDNQVVAPLFIGEDLNKKHNDFSADLDDFYFLDEYSYIIIPLKRLMKASIETGNPVIWS